MSTSIRSLVLSETDYLLALRGTSPVMSLFENEYILFSCEERKLLAMHSKGRVFPVISTETMGILPLDAAQSAYMDSLFAEQIPLNVAVGPSGTGKTLLTLAYATHQMHEQGKTIVLSKPTVQVGKTGAFGTVPGDVQDKFRPYLGSYEAVLSELLNGAWKMYMDRGKISFTPLEFIRGITFKNCIVILDECQNASWHELYTLISRIGEGSQLILLGDVRQIDRHFHKGSKSGLSALLSSDKFKTSTCSSVVELTRVYRSELCELAIEIDEELRENAVRYKSKASPGSVADL